MFAYNTMWIDALSTSREAKRWMESRLISSEQYATIKTANTTPLYTPNLFVRIALYVFTATCISGVTGLAALIVDLDSSLAAMTTFIVLGIGTIVTLEILIKQKYLYCAGIDDALLYAALGLTVGGILGIIYSAEKDMPLIVPPSLVLLFCVAATVRYADRLTTLTAYGCLIFIIGKIMVYAGGIVEALIPFAVIIISLAVYIACVASGERAELHAWKKCFSILDIASLVTLYLGGNYLIVRHLTELLLQFEVPAGGDIPFAVVFYALTVAIPATYIALGVRRRDSILLRVGLLAAAFSVFTFRFYFSIAPPEIALTFGGIVLIGVAVWTIRFLKVPKNGITQEKLLSKKFENLDTEMLVVSQTLGATSQSEQQDFKPGGGGFGGGGTTESW